jgi:2-polyprenyl-6-methoxyphenol hydroxylase-like FAD-dependent oxidoreductase
MRILIVGGGVAGLTLAALLRQRGEEPDIVECVTEYGRVGNLISLWPMGNRVLRGLRLYEGFGESSVPLRTHVLLDGKGQVIRTSDLSARMAPYGEIRTLERADLIDLLRSHGGGVPVRTGTTVERIEQDWMTGTSANDRPARVLFSDGSEGEFDVVVGADGFRSRVRRLLFGEVTPKYTGSVLYWWWEDIPLGIEPSTENKDFLGPGRLLGLYSGKYRSARYAMLPAAEAEEANEPSANSLDNATELTEARKALLRERLSGFGGETVRKVLDRLDDAGFVERLELADLLAPRWHMGRIALVGDCAATVLPTAGVGASLAMESAAVLADELSRTSARYLPGALRFYEDRRRKRVERLQNASRQMIRLSMVRWPMLAAVRDAALRRMPESIVAGDVAQLLERPI